MRLFVYTVSKMFGFSLIIYIGNNKLAAIEVVLLFIGSAFFMLISSIVKYSDKNGNISFPWDKDE